MSYQEQKQEHLLCSIPLATTYRIGTELNYTFPTDARLLVGVRRRMIGWITSQQLNLDSTKRTGSLLYQEKKEWHLLCGFPITSIYGIRKELNYTFTTDAWLLVGVRRRMIGWITLQQLNLDSTKRTGSSPYQEKKERHLLCGFPITSIYGIRK